MLPQQLWDRLGVRGSAVRPWTRGELVARLARLLLWTAVAVVVIRGVGDVFAGHSATTPGTGIARVTGAGGWPDDPARALAVQFATAYLSHSPKDEPAAVAAELAAMASPQVADALAPRFPHRAPRQVVRAAAVADGVAVDARRALITVAVSVQTGRVLLARRVTVPIARDNGRGLVVDDLPGFAPVAGVARTEPAETEPLPGSSEALIEDVVTRFLRAYLVGDVGGLSYLAVPGARIPASSARLELLSVASVGSVGRAAGGGRLVVVVRVHARDPRSRVAYWLGYRLRLVRRDRWYVADLNGPGVRGGWR